MFDWITVIVGIIGVIGSAIGAFVGLRTLLKKPHIVFSLPKKAEISLYNEESDENLTLLMAPVANKKKLGFGDVAKKVSAMVIYRAPVDDKKVGLNANIEVPWLKSFGSRTKIAGQLNSEEDIGRALEDRLFDRKERDIPQGRGEHLAVAYGIEKTNKLFLASNPPIEIPLPSPKKQQMGFRMSACPLRLEVAGENLSSTLSEGTVIVGDSWKNWGFPERVETMWTPSRLRNLLLRLGFGREVKILGSKTSHED